MKITIEDLDIAEFQCVAHDYFGMDVSDAAARHLCETFKPVQAELVYGGLHDTAARDDVVAAILDLVFGDARVPRQFENRFGGFASDRWDYPCNADTDEYKAAFDEAFIAACEKLPPDRKVSFVS